MPPADICFYILWKKTKTVSGGFTNILFFFLLLTSIAMMVRLTHAHNICLFRQMFQQCLSLHSANRWFSAKFLHMHICDVWNGGHTLADYLADWCGCTVCHSNKSFNILSLTSSLCISHSQLSFSCIITTSRKARLASLIPHHAYLWRHLNNVIL